MKICYVNYYNPLMIHGGAERVVLREAQLLAQSGNEAVIVTTHNAKQFRHTVLENGKLKVWFLPNLLRFDGDSLTHKSISILLSLYNPLLITYLKRILAMEKPDIVHIHSYGLMSKGIVNAAKQSGSMVIQTFHGYAFECPKDSLYRRSGALCTNPLPLCRVYEKVYRKTTHSPDSIIAICSYVKERLIRAGYNPEDISFIPNSINNSLEASEPGAKNEEILFVGRMVRAKGVHVLIKALAKVQEIYGAGLSINLIGDGEDKVYFQSLAQSLGVHTNFLGKVTDEILQDNYRNAYFVVVPSLFPELCPTVVLEAMSHGKPVIASNIGGIPDLVLHGETGLLFEPSNVNKLADCIKTLLYDKKLVSQMGNRALQSSQEFSDAIHLDKLLNLYHRVLERDMQ